MHKTPYIFAHRGASFHAPENTASAFKKAYELSAHGIETDIHYTADKQLVVHHNYTVDTTSNGSGKVEDMTLEDLKQLDFGSYKDVRFKDERILTLDEFLDLVKDFKEINIELKGPTSQKESYVKNVIDTIERHGLKEKVILSGFDHKLLGACRALCPDIRIGLIIGNFLGSKEATTGFRHLIPADVPLSMIPKEALWIKDEAILKALGLNADNVGIVLYELLNAISAWMPGMSVEQVIEELSKQGDIINYVRSVDYDFDFVHLDYTIILAHPGIVDALDDLGLGVSAWTPDNADVIKKLKAMNLYGIITNRPDIALESLR